MVLLLLAHCSVACGGLVFGFCFVMQYTGCFLVCNNLASAEEAKAGSFTLIVFLLKCKCSLSLLPCVSAVCDFLVTCTFF